MEHRYGGTSVQPSTAETYAEPDGTIVIRFRAGTRLDAALTAEVADAHIRLAHGEKRPVLADCRGLFAADRASRELAAGPGIVAVTARLAMVVDKPVTRVLGNFFLRVTTPAYPTRMFGDEASARSWLKEQQP